MALYSYDTDQPWPDEPTELVSFLRGQQALKERPRYATSQTGVVEPCVLCGADCDDKTGLCPYHLAAEIREPYPGYDRAFSTPEGYGW